MLASLLAIAILRALHYKLACMNAPFLKRWTTWLLPLIVLRAFIPMGFMLGSGPHGLQLMFCPGVMQAADSHSAVAHSGASTEAASHGNQHRESHGQNEHAPCPYGLIGAAACAEPIYLAVGRAGTDAPIVLPSIPLLDRSPVRAEPIRGPPFSSLDA